jgi:AraC-like DNA-binding protein
MNKDILNPSAGGAKGNRSGTTSREEQFDASKINQKSFVYDNRLNRVKHYVDRHYADRLSLARVASVAGLERSYFSKYFHKKTGVCYHDWLHWIRVSHAIELMQAHNFTITDIAYSVGYRDLRTFERAFEKCTGRCPRTMKKEIASKFLN